MTILPPVRWHYRRSLASRVALLTTLALGFSLTVMALGAYVVVRTQMKDALDESLLERAHVAASSPALGLLINKVPSEAMGAADVRIYLVSAQGYARSMDRGSELPLGQPEVDVASGEVEHELRTVRTDGTSYRIVAVPYEDDQALVIAQSMEPQERTLRKLGAATLLLGAVGLAIAGVAGWAVARNGLRPVRRLTDSVERVARTAQLAPLTVEGDDEVARLATAFNQLIAAVSSAQQRQRQLVADASHELRTPLTSLRTNLDLLAQADASPGLMPDSARRELLDDVQAQAEEMTTLITDLVELARDEPIQADLEDLDLADVLDRALARVRLRAPGIDFDVSARSWVVHGEAGPLERAITNLLDNAAKWSPAGGTVHVQLNGGTLVVTDEGPGFSADDLPHVFERFYRASESRGMAGSGLGLSIVQQIATRHGGAVSARNAPQGGAQLTLTLPGRDALTLR